eukprot:CAMPEP_0114558782 /NCGR_PEP_ID=MMETSP0114-20121206/10569_1 /TAXON_ID=31324 /ORGANISM="Goniomonas sp, Strain m" /LENGTH=69 /DNA_ID=CAMNT_0001744203 /DNA_START=21 /DNA_END=230 /DNA_ORIENTATION=-
MFQTFSQLSAARFSVLTGGDDQLVPAWWQNEAGAQSNSSFQGPGAEGDLWNPPDLNIGMRRAPQAYGYR